MPRQKRVVLPGIAHHITQRGNNRRDVFFCDEDRAVYLSLLNGYALEYGMDVLGLCLMTNHIHLIAVPHSETSLAKALGRTHHDYARWLHIRRRESGHLWQNRFFSCPLAPAFTWAALAYVERNPVRAGMVARAEEWAWSSAREHLGEGRFRWLDLRMWSAHWGPSLWRSVLEAGLAEAEIKARMHEATQGGRPLGDALFTEECERKCGTPLRKQKPGPKRKAIPVTADHFLGYDAA